MRRLSGRCRSPIRAPPSCGSGDDLEARGITLIVMPTPLKPGVHPEMLARRLRRRDGRAAESFVSSFHR